MRRFVFIALAIALVFSAASAQARTEVVKTYCMSLAGFGARDMGQVKTELLLGAKRLAVAELFGEMVSSLSRVTDFTLSQDEVTALGQGYIRLAGDPLYQNGLNFGEVCVTIRAYAEDEDYRKMQPLTLSGKKCVADPDMTAAKLKESAMALAVKDALLRYEPGLEGLNPRRLSRLAHQVKIIRSGFLPETETYCVEFEATVFPVEIASSIHTAPKPNEAAPLIQPLPNSALTASSVYANDFPNYGPQNSRLNEKTTFSNWSAGANDSNQWLQADLSKPAVIYSVATKGRAVSYYQWVKEYRISYSLDGSTWAFVGAGGTPMVFVGNSDQNTEVRHSLPEPITARFIRIHPVSWNEHITLRWELWGAYEKD